MSDQRDEQQSAEELDGDVLGDDPSTDARPNLRQQGETGPMSFDDPAVSEGGTEILDDERTRTWREEPEVGDRGAHWDDRETIVLLDEAGDGPDHEEQLLADSEKSDGTDGPEDAAIHIIED